MTGQSDEYDAVADVLEAEDRRCKAMVAADRPGLLAQMGQDAVVLHGSGAVESRDPFVKNLFDRIEVRSITILEPRVRVFGDVAILTGVQKQSVRLRSKENFDTAYANVSEVWVKQSGGWTLQNFHATRIEPPATT